MRPVKAREIQARLLSEGWVWQAKRGSGSHRVFVHPTLPGLIVLTWHKNGNAEVSPCVMSKIVEIAGW